jgi:hypothetical protein
MKKIILFILHSLFKNSSIFGFLACFAGKNSSIFGFLACFAGKNSSIFGFLACFAGRNSSATSGSIGVAIFGFLACFAGFITTAQAKGNFTFSPLARQAYDYTLAMRWDEAHALVKQLRETEPNNKIADYVDNQLDCFKIFIDDDRKQLNNLDWKQEHWLNALEEGDKDSPYYLFTRAQARLLWAMNRAKFGSYLTAFNELSVAYEELEKNRKKFPTFKPNQLSLGVLHAIIGSIPDGYKWGVKFLNKRQLLCMVSWYCT